MDPQGTRPGPTRTTAARRAPRLGALDALEFRDAANARLRRATGWRYLWGRIGSHLPWGRIGVVAALLVLLVLVMRRPLADWLWPQTGAQRLHDRAGQALAAGRLTATDGTGARELYEAELAQDPDRFEARDGLNRVGQAALVQAQQALDRRQYDQARQALALARALSMPRDRIDALADKLRTREAAAAGLDGLIARAAAARAAGHLDDGPDAALPLYLRVLDLQPDRVQALEGREDTLADLLQQARERLAAADLAAAAPILTRVQAADPGHVDLPEALAERARAVERQRTRADAALAAGRLAEAKRAYATLRAIDADDMQAQRGLAAVATGHARRSERFAADFRFADAQAELRRAQAAAAGLDESPDAIAQARMHLARARQSQRQLPSAPATAQRARRVADLLDAAMRAQARGDLITPPGDSAFDALRAAHALAPDDPRVRAAVARLMTAAGACFDEALRGNRLIRAGTCLDARRALEGDTPTARAGRRELAIRWLARGDERLGAGDIEQAQAALQSARALDAGAPGLAEFARRVRAASAAPQTPPQ